jgi:hypothetical protein
VLYAVKQLTKEMEYAMGKRLSITALGSAALIALTAACAPIPTDQDALPGSDTTPQGVAAETVDTSDLEPFSGTIPTCTDLAASLGSIIDGFQPKMNDFDRRGSSSGLENARCNWVNDAYVARGDGKTTIGFVIQTAKITKEAYIANTDGATDRVIEGAADALGGASFGVDETLTAADTTPKSGVISVFDGVTITTVITADETSTDAPTVADTISAQTEIAKALGLG